MPFLYSLGIYSNLYMLPFYHLVYSRSSAEISYTKAVHVTTYGNAVVYYLLLFMDIFKDFLLFGRAYVLSIGHHENKVCMWSVIFL